MPKCASQESLHQTMRYSASRIATPYGSARPAWRERASECASWRLRAVSARCRRYSSVNTSSHAPLPSGTASVSEREAHWRSRLRWRTWWRSRPTSPSEKNDHPQPAPKKRPVPNARTARRRTMTAVRIRILLILRLSEEDQEPHHCDVDKAQEYRSAADVLRPLCEEVIFQGNPVDRGLQRRIEQLHDQHQQDTRDHQRSLGSAYGDEEGRRNQQRCKQAFLAERIFVPKRGGHALERIAERVPQALYPGLALEVTFLHSLFVGGKESEQLLLRRARYPAARLPSLLVAVGVHFPSLAVVL